jgi:predicted unusual protein kinase regulating ubiquinone biosynthesis (AarF/ABC1/UbiB family)
MGTLSRLAGLGSLVGRTTTRYVQGRVRGALGRAEPDEATVQVREVVAQLSRLKGAAMKAGQQLALLAVHLDLPPEIRAALGTLHAAAEPVPFERIRAAIEASLGASIESHFAELSPTPLGTASLAQAHAARLKDGRRVVVKVLHDGVTDAVEADLLAFRTLLRSGRVLVGRDPREVEDIVAEVEERLREELDYLQEAVHIEAFGRLFAADPGVIVPVHVPALCTDRVLVMDHVPGRPLDAFVASADRATRQRAGEHLADWFFRGTFHHHLLHADPHPGNYLFGDDGRIGVVDFGCVKRFDPYFLAVYARTVLAALEGDRDGALEGCLDLAIWDGADAAAGDAIWGFCDALVRPWRDGPTVIGPGEEDLVVRLRPASERLWQFPSVRGARDLLFLHRSLAGMYAMARVLEVRGDWGGLLRRHLSVAIEAGRA